MPGSLNLTLKTDSSEMENVNLYTHSLWCALTSLGTSWQWVRLDWQWQA